MSKSKRKPEAQVCYVCGQYRNSVTDDHVPPKFLAPENPRSDFQFAPACRDCNNQFSHLESKFRDFLAVCCGNAGVKEADDALAAFTRNVQRNPPKDIRIPQKDLARVMEGVRTADAYSPGGIYLGKVPTIRPSAEVDVSTVLVKIARGLHYVHTGEIVPASYQMAGQLYHELPYQEILSGLPAYGQASDFFHYRGGASAEDPRAGVWYMIFYRKVFGFALFCPSKERLAELREMGKAQELARIALQERVREVDRA